MTGASLYLGVDGGATRCRARLRDTNGKALAAASGAAANSHVDFAAAVAVIGQVIDEVLGKAGFDRADKARIAIGFGLAGFSDPSDEARVVEAFPGYCLARAANRGHQVTRSWWAISMAIWAAARWASPGSTRWRARSLASRW